MNFGQRYLELATSYTKQSDTGEVIMHVSQMPPNANIFQPGPAMLFLVVDGIPSMGEVRGISGVWDLLADRRIAHCDWFRSDRDSTERSRQCASGISSRCQWSSVRATKLVDRSIWTCGDGRGSCQYGRCYSWTGITFACLALCLACDACVALSSYATDWTCLSQSFGWFSSNLGGGGGGGGGNKQGWSDGIGRISSDLFCSSTCSSFFSLRFRSTPTRFLSRAYFDPIATNSQRIHNPTPTSIHPPPDTYLLDDP